MLKFISSRILHSLISLLAISLVVFSLSHMTGSPVDALLPDDATPQQIENLTVHLGLDRPLHVQYLTFLQNALTGDFGDSTKWKGSTAAAVVWERLPATLQLGGLAMLMSVVFAIPMGVLSAVKRNSWFDTFASGFALLGQSLPTFWLGIVLMWIFAVMLGWFPTSGYGTIWHMILPAFSMAWFQIAALTRLTRSAMLEVLDAEYIKLARIKGVGEQGIIWRHAFRNAAIVPVTYFGVLAGSLLTGSVVVETVFAWPGTGLLAIDAIRGRDFPVVQAVVMFFAIFYLLANFIVDILYAVIDPGPDRHRLTMALKDTKLRILPVLPIATLMIVLVIPALFADFISPHDPYKAYLRNRLEPPLFFGGTTEFILGTDKLGRDILSRIMHGAKYALVISLVGIILGAVVGTFLGLVAGYYRGWIEALIMRVVDITFALPSILLALALASVSGPSFQLVIFVVIFVIWGFFARQIRAETLVLRERDFVARARVAGASNARILRKYILPNVMNTIVVLATLQIGVVVVLEATLSFLGIGIPRPTPAWGLLVADGRQLIVSSWWISFFPGMAILLTVLSVNKLGDNLRDLLDPKLRQA